MTIGDFIKKCDTYKPLEIAAKILIDHEQDLIKIQRSQWWAGMNAKGQKITPNILNDPFFDKVAARINSKKKKGKKKVTATELANNWSVRKASRLNNKGIPFEVFTAPEFGTYNYGDVNLIFSTGVRVWEHLNVSVTGNSNDVVIDLNNNPIFQRITQKYESLFGLNPEGAKFAAKLFFNKEFMTKTHEHYGL